MNWSVAFTEVMFLYYIRHIGYYIFFLSLIGNMMHSFICPGSLSLVTLSGGSHFFKLQVKMG